MSGGQPSAFVYVIMGIPVSERRIRGMLAVTQMGERICIDIEKRIHFHQFRAGS